MKAVIVPLLPLPHDVLYSEKSNGWLVGT
jgi:hypothetical protein